jgi:hypothetical protein
VRSIVDSLHREAYEEAGGGVEALDALDALDDTGFSPLHIAAKNGDFDVVQVLLGTGRVDARKKTGDGSTALHLAAASCYDDIYMYDFEAEANVVDILIRSGACVHERDECKGWTAMHYACDALDLNASKVRLLAEAGGYEAVNALTKDGMHRPLTLVSHQTFLPDFLKVCSDAGVRVDAASVSPNKGFNAFHAMCVSDEREVAVMLLLDDANVDVDVNATFTGTSLTALKCAINRKNEEVVMMLLKHHRSRANLTEQVLADALETAMYHRQPRFRDAIVFSGLLNEVHWFAMYYDIERTTDVSLNAALKYEELRRKKSMTRSQHHVDVGFQFPRVSTLHRAFLRALCPPRTDLFCMSEKRVERDELNAATLTIS